MNKLPIYKATIADEAGTGMLRISLVDDPAVESFFLAFDKQEKVQLYKVSDEEKRLVRGVVMRADYPIYRDSAEIGEYYLIFTKDEIRKIAEKYLLEGRQNEVNLMHRKGSEVEGVQMVQYFIKGDGVSVEDFDDISEGSLFAEFHIVNDDIWESIKEGTYKGFSLEGMFNLEKVNLNKKRNMTKLQRIKAALAALLQEFGSITTDRGVVVWDGDEDLKEGDFVYIEDAEGNRTNAEDGDYKTEDGKTIKVVEGKVAEILDPEAEVAPAAEEEEQAEEQKLGSKATDKGELIWEGEEDLKAGDEVFVRNEAGELEAAPDGDYTTEDSKVIKVVDGKVSEITDAEAEVAPVEEADAEKEALKAENDALKAELESLKAELETLKKQPAAAPAHEAFTSSSNPLKTGLKGIDKLQSYLKK